MSTQTGSSVLSSIPLTGETRIAEEWMDSTASMEASLLLPPQQKATKTTPVALSLGQRSTVQFVSTAQAVTKRVLYVAYQMQVRINVPEAVLSNEDILLEAGVADQLASWIRVRSYPLCRAMTSFQTTLLSTSITANPALELLALDLTRVHHEESFYGHMSFNQSPASYTLAKDEYTAPAKLPGMTAAPAAGGVYPHYETSRLTLVEATRPKNERDIILTYNISHPIPFKPWATNQFVGDQLAGFTALQTPQVAFTLDSSLEYLIDRKYTGITVTSVELSKNANFTLWEAIPTAALNSLPRTDQFPVAVVDTHVKGNSIALADTTDPQKTFELTTAVRQITSVPSLMIIAATTDSEDGLASRRPTYPRFGSIQSLNVKFGLLTDQLVSRSAIELVEMSYQNGLALLPEGIHDTSSANRDFTLATHDYTQFPVTGATGLPILVNPGKDFNASSELPTVPGMQATYDLQVSATVKFSSAFLSKHNTGNVRLEFFLIREAYLDNAGLQYHQIDYIMTPTEVAAKISAQVLQAAQPDASSHQIITHSGPGQPQLGGSHSHRHWHNFTRWVKKKFVPFAKKAVTVGEKAAPWIKKGIEMMGAGHGGSSGHNALAYGGGGGEDMSRVNKRVRMENRPAYI